MHFDPTNQIVKLCVAGMEQEGLGKLAAAGRLFDQAWQQATTAVEQLIAAHYVARQQPSAADKLQWDETALQLALALPSDEVGSFYASLYLNVAKGYEDTGQWANAVAHYRLAASFTPLLLDDGYGRLLKGGIMNGLQRVAKKASPK
jgi:hypothetical protein